MSEILAGISLAFGFYLGWLLRTVFVMAAISRQQDRMQRIVLYWQSEAIYARRTAEHRRRLLAALTSYTTGAGDKHGPGEGPQDSWADPHEPI